jgi:AcrR family transcriptional regulator
VQNANKNEDLRVRRTRMMLQNAVIELTVEREGFKDITIADISERAMVNRSTFYRHYLDKCDLLAQYMNDVYDLIADEKVAAEERGDVPEELPSGLVTLLRHIQENADFYRIMFGPEGDPGFVADFRKNVEKRFRYLYSISPKKKDDPNSAPFELRLSYIAYADIGAILWWLENEQPCTVEELARWLGQLSSNSAGFEYNFYANG